MPNEGDIIYWDTNIFFSHLSGEQRHDRYEKAGIEEVVRLVDSDKITLVTSVITLIEILAGQFTKDDVQKYKALVKRPNVNEIEVHKTVAQIAHEIRSEYQDQGRLPSLPDSIHLATAIWARATEFQTFDGSGKKRKGILDFNGEAIVHNLSIVKPFSNEPLLF